MNVIITTDGRVYSCSLFRNGEWVKVEVRGDNRIPSGDLFNFELVDDGKAPYIKIVKDRRKRWWRLWR